MADEVFGSNRPPAGEEFFKWIQSGRVPLVAGGKLLAELNRTSVRQWASQAINAGRIKTIVDEEVDSKADELLDLRSCRSNDTHVIALAQISGTRLLYTNDGDLQRDFKTKELIDNPRGKIYSTLESKEFTRVHRQLLTRRDLCRA